MAKFRVLMTELMHHAGTELLGRDCQLIYSENCRDAETLKREATDVDAILVRTEAQITAEVIDAAPRLKVIARHGAGVENIDLAAASDRGILVVNTPEANIESVAEHSVAMILALGKRIPEADAALRQGDWSARTRCFGHELSGRTVGIIGLGRIGKRIAHICKIAFECEILYSDIGRQKEAEKLLDARYVLLEELLSSCDVLSVNAPLTPETRNLIGPAEFKKMRKGVILIQVSRGGAVHGTRK